MVIDPSTEDYQIMKFGGFVYVSSRGEWINCGFGYDGEKSAERFINVSKTIKNRTAEMLKWPKPKLRAYLNRLSGNTEQKRNSRKVKRVEFEIGYSD